MIFRRNLAGLGRRAGSLRLTLVLLFFIVQFLSWTGLAALPRRLVLALDGVAYRDMKAVQEGVTYTDPKGHRFFRIAFAQDYFPVSRLISTFPSVSDAAWTAIFGDRPLPGYQRTYFCQAANLLVSQNGLTTSTEYERQMTWQSTGLFHRALGYSSPRHAFKFEVRELIKHFLNATNQGETFFAYFRSTDDGQHLSADILALLSSLDETLQSLRATYRAREGRELEIVILSDHGNNHAGPAERVGVRAFLKRAGYRVTKSILSPKDVVLPTAGIESWVEVHNAPSETEKLVELLSHLKGVDLVTAQDPTRSDRFLLMNSRGEEAAIEWKPLKNSFRYSPRTGDPIRYLPVSSVLSRKGQLDAEGFATADAWMAETLDHHYPLALERIVRAHTRVVLNPATILLSLDNAYVHSGWWVKKGSELVRSGGTHGALDDLNSTGILLTSFVPTPDTSANRVAALFDGFKGLRDFRAEEDGAEWVCAQAQSLAAIPRTPLDGAGELPAGDAIYLRIWTPRFAHLPPGTPIEVSVKKARQFLYPPMRRGDPQPVPSPGQRFTLDRPLVLPRQNQGDRTYAFPASLVLEPGREYLITGRAPVDKTTRKIFSFAFRADQRGRPIAY